MGIRITDGILARTTLADVTRQRQSLARLQEQAASGLRINRPSDDPIGVRAATVLRAQIEDARQLSRNQERAEQRLVATESALDRSLDVIARARELALAGANGSMDSNARLALAAEVEQLHGELLAAANSRDSGAYLFGGHASATAAFSSTGDFVSAPPPVVTFAGDASEIEVEIDHGLRAPVTLDGRRTFLGDADGDGSADAGRQDAFAVLADLWQALQNDDAIATAATLDGLDRAQLQLSLERTRVGTVHRRVELARDVVADRELAGQRRLSEIEDADTVAVLSELVSREAALRASLEATARIIQPSLLDFLS